MIIIGMMMMMIRMISLGAIWKETIIVLFLFSPSLAQCALFYGSFWVIINFASFLLSHFTWSFALLSLTHLLLSLFCWSKIIIIIRVGDLLKVSPLITPYNSIDFSHHTLLIYWFYSVGCDSPPFEINAKKKENN